jgi:hypothetical protein
MASIHNLLATALLVLTIQTHLELIESIAEEHIIQDDYQEKKEYNSNM